MSATLQSSLTTVPSSSNPGQLSPIKYNPPPTSLSTLRPEVLPFLSRLRFFIPLLGVRLALTDNSTVEVPLGGYSFPFLGTNYSSIFVNSDGYITLGAGDSDFNPRDVFHMIDGLPRIAPLLEDLNVEAGGSINVSVRTDRVVVTWMVVPGI